MDDDTLFAWMESLDALTYYELLQVDPTATHDDLKRAYHEFAETFHPDGHPGRAADERAALDAIFKRGTEAYSVLSEPTLRARYDAALAHATGEEPAPRVHTVPPPAASRSSAPPPPRLSDGVTSPSARAFVRRAEELVEKGDLKQAKLQMVMATHLDPENELLRDYLRQIEEQMKK